MGRISLTWLAVIVTGLLIVRTSEAAELPPYFGAVVLPAQRLPWTAEASADFGALLGRLGEQTALDPASVRVVDAAGTVLPTRFEPDKGATDRGIVRWNVPAAAVEQKVDFKICFAPKSSQKWQAVQPEVVGPANLLPNGDFETPDETGKLPKYWTRITQNAELVKDAKRAHSGEHCMKLIPFIREGQTASEANIQTPGVPGIVVEGGKNYSCRFWTKAEGAAKGLVCAAAVYFYDAEKQYILHDGIGATFDGEYDWLETSKTFQSPPKARYAMFYPMFYSTRGALYLDDFSISLAQAPQLDSAQNADGSKKASLGMAAAGVKRFDFGPENAAVWPNFVAVTPKMAYAKEQGFGWVGDTRPMDGLRDLPDTLARTFVFPVNPCRFAVDLPDGDYKAWFLIGDNGLGETIIPTNVNESIKLGGVELFGYHPDAKSWYETVVFRNLNDWWTPGIDVYERFIAPQYSERTFDLKVTGGQAAIELQGLPVGALVVYPAALDAAMRDELARLRADRKRSVPVRYNPSAPEAATALSPAEQGRGYALFARDAAREVFPASAPQEGELVTKLSTFAAPGELKGVSFALYPLRDLGEVSVTVSDLKGPGGLLPAQAVEVGVVRYVESLLDSKEYRYTVVPGPIQPRNPMPVPKGMTVRWWLTLRTPAEVKPGDYSGKITIAPSKAAKAELDLTVKILPIPLDSVPITAGLYHFDRTYWYIYWWRGCFGADAWLREATIQHEKEDFRLLKEFGMNSLSFCEDNRGMAWNGQGWVFPKEDRFTLWMDLYKEAGMGPMPWYGFAGLGIPYLSEGLYTSGRKLEMFSPEWEKAYRSMIDWVQKTRAERGWPEVIFYLSDELSNEGEKGAEMGRKLVQLTKDIPGIRTVASMNGPFEKVLLPGLKIAMPNHAFPINEETIAQVRRNGDELFVYNCGNSRVMWGLYLWRIGAKGRFQWYDRYAYGEPWNAFDGNNDYSVTWVTPGKPLPSVDLWWIHEGLTDLRYLAALEKAIAVAKRSGKPAAAQAAEAGQKALDALRDLVPEEARLLTGAMDPREAGKPAVGKLADSAFLDQQRESIANCIVAIQAALGQ